MGTAWLRCPNSSKLTTSSKGLYICKHSFTQMTVSATKLAISWKFIMKNGNKPIPCIVSSGLQFQRRIQMVDCIRQSIQRLTVGVFLALYYAFTVVIKVLGFLRNSPLILRKRSLNILQFLAQMSVGYSFYITMETGLDQ